MAVAAEDSHVPLGRQQDGAGHRSGRAARARGQQLRHWGRRLAEERRIGMAFGSHHSAEPAVDHSDYSDDSLVEVHAKLDRILHLLTSSREACLAWVATLSLQPGSDAVVAPSAGPGAGATEIPNRSETGAPPDVAAAVVEEVGLVHKDRAEPEMFDLSSNCSELPEMPEVPPFPFTSFHVAEVVVPDAGASAPGCHPGA